MTSVRPSAPIEYAGTLASASDWSYWLRVVLVQEAALVLIALVAASFHQLPAAGVLVVGVTLTQPLGQRVAVSADGVVVRWLFVRKRVPIGAVVEVAYALRRGIFDELALRVAVADGPPLEIRARAATLHALAADFARNGHRITNDDIEQVARPAIPWRVMLPLVAILLGLLIGFASFAVK